MVSSSGPDGWSDAAPFSNRLDPLDPTSIGSWELLGRLGQGGMGVVYLGRDPDGQRGAVKVINPQLTDDPGYSVRFDSEVAYAGRVASFCTARVLDHGNAGGLAYLVTEYIEGPSLSGYIKAHGVFPSHALRSLAAGVAAALAEIHAVSLVHRDLKPGNVLLAVDGPRVIDFGIARALDSHIPITQPGNVIGTAGYVAPEFAFEGRVGAAGDIFAWGALVAHAASGHNPFGSGTLQELAVRAKQAQYDLTGVPHEFVPIVESALDPDPARRPTAKNLLVQLVGESTPREATTELIRRCWLSGPSPAATAARPPEDGPPGSSAEAPSGGASGSRREKAGPRAPKHAKAAPSLASEIGSRVVRYGRRNALITVSALVLFALAAGFLLKQESFWPPNKTARFGIKNDQPGTGFGPSYSKLSGLDIAIAGMAAGALGKEAKFEPLSSEQRRTAFLGKNGGKVDFIVSTYSISQERMDGEEKDFIGPYAVTGTGFLLKSNHPPPQSIYDLRGMKVCTWGGTTSKEILEKVAEIIEDSGRSLELLNPPESAGECVDQLNKGKVEAVFSDELIMQGFALQPGSNLVAIPSASVKDFPDKNQRWGIALPRGHRKECMQIKSALRKYIENGEWNRVFKENFKGLDEDRYRPDVKLIEKYSCVDRLPKESPQVSP
ncbi:transporter substrate-binding domain-containing protein [Actinomadura geliboluensis]|uniref:Transporter substrate-binding domain-containing protein n=1 Tax=Actinomadura geliboluensis TaxID=882440 RepID=A0A5S4GHZ7_9ACTN|nr:transporter substrate-binding domain-containing protein [Actinomadura geliboluensis]